MPTDPHTWVDVNDYLTATLLNGDMYRWNGQEFYPTGIRHHARRPIYASFSGGATAATLATNTWGPAYDLSGGSQGPSVVRGDTGMMINAAWDPNMTGNIRMNLNAGSGTALTQGGLALMFGHVQWPNASSGSFGAGLGLYNGTSASQLGTLQAANSVSDQVTWVCDIVDGDSQRWTIFGFNNTGSNQAPNATVNADGSGKANRLHAQWVSVYPNNGFTIGGNPSPLASWSNSTILDANLLNGSTGFRNVLRYLNMPPLLRMAQGGTQSLTASTTNTVHLGSTTYDTYNAFNGGTDTYTVPFGGIYFVHGYVGCQGFSGNLRAGVSINGTTYWGPGSPMPSSGQGTATKTQLFSLNAGDTIKLLAFPTASATTSSLYVPRLIVYCICPKNITTPTAGPPDTTFRWAAGTQGPLTTLFNTYIANDLGFLTNQRPYALAYQATAQTGIAMNTATPVIMDTDSGIVHGENCDRRNSFNTTTGVYTAPRAGWYMAVWEVFLATPSLTVSPNVTATAALNPAGSAPDQYQKQNMVTSGFPGATGMAYYYLRAGDTFTPGVQTQNSSSTTIGTQVTTGVNSSFGIIWIGE